jgi:SAM-dependent methyltransferase
MQSDVADLDRFRQRTVDVHFEFLRKLGTPIQLGATVLDFGCGIGDAVDHLLELDYDAYGVDIIEFWGKDIERWWLKKEAPSQEVKNRLFCVSRKPYHLPFPDAFFDFCFSGEVFEHVANPMECFVEIARVLKPGAISLHRFPGPNSPIEGHIKFPLAALCHWMPWVSLCSYLGFRPLCGAEWKTKETIENCRTWMSEVFYPTKHRLHQYAREAQVEIAFFERQDFISRDIGSLARARHAAEGIGLGPIARLALPFFAQRYMALRRPTQRYRPDRASTLRT